MIPSHTDGDNIVAIFYRNVERYAPDAAIVDERRSVSYGELGADVRRVARHLEQRGIRRGDHVLIFVPMSRELYTILLALFHLGAAAVFVDAWADRSRLERAASTVPLRAFVGIPRAHLLRLVSPALRAIPIKLGAGVDRWRSDGVVPAVADVEGDDTALVTFTTGSTGAPKGARRSHRFLLAQHRAIVESFGSVRTEVDMPTLPIFVLNNLALGATSVLPAVDPRRSSGFDASMVLGQIARHGVETSTGSPAFFLRLGEGRRKNRKRGTAEGAEGAERKEGELRRIFVGGAAVGPRAAERIAAAFPEARVTVVYGSTEAEPVSLIDARAMIDSARSQVGLPVGRPVAGIEALIVPITGGSIDVASDEALRAVALAPGEAGEICVAGPHVLDAYYGDPAEWSMSKIQTDSRRWHRTGDAGYMDESGSLYLLGRVRESFVRDGRRVFPLPVEERLIAIDAVRSGTILSVDGLAVVAIEAESGADRDAIARAVRDGSIEHDILTFVATIPRDPRHHSKIDYEKLRERVRGLMQR
jgi:acyl-CoA synthetase (AMP-forming)/AMP-acid ligase II